MKITRASKHEDEIMELLNREIVRELLAQEGASTDDAAVDAMWERVKPNAWDTPIIYRLLQKGVLK